MGRKEGSAELVLDQQAPAQDLRLLRSSISFFELNLSLQDHLFLPSKNLGQLVLGYGSFLMICLY